jgi:hypothetical protein
VGPFGPLFPARIEVFYRFLRLPEPAREICACDRRSSCNTVVRFIRKTIIDAGHPRRGIPRQGVIDASKTVLLPWLQPSWN